MSLFLRKIHKSYWMQNLEWITDEEVQADVFRDLQTDTNQLSFWLIDREKNNLHRIIAGMASNCEHVPTFDLLLLPEERFSDLDIKKEKTVGVTHDNSINQEYHFDAMELTTNKLNELAIVLKKHAEIQRINNKKVASYLAKSVKDGYIKFESLKDKIRDKIKDNLNK